MEMFLIKAKVGGKYGLSCHISFLHLSYEYFPRKLVLHYTLSRFQKKLDVEVCLNLILRVKMIYLNLFATESLVLSKVTLCLQYRVITNSMQHKASREAYSRQKIPRRTGTVFTRAVTCHCPQPKESSPHPHSHIRYILILSYNTQVGLYSAINIR